MYVLSEEEKERIKADEWERTKRRLLYTPLYVIVAWLTLILIHLIYYRYYFYLSLLELWYLLVD